MPRRRSISIAVTKLKSRKTRCLQDREVTYLTSTPHCWRTDKPGALTTRSIPWFIRTTALRERMIELEQDDPLET